MIDLDAQRADPLQLLRTGEGLARQGQDAPARVAWERAWAALSPDDRLRRAFARIRQAHAELGLRDLAAARDHLHEALRGLDEDLHGAHAPGDAPARPRPGGEAPGPELLLRADEPDPSSAAALGRWLTGLAWRELGYLASIERRYAEAVTSLGRALGAFEALGCPRDEGDAHRVLAITRVYSGDHDQAALEFARAIGCYEAADEPSLAAVTRGATSYLLASRGRHADAVAALDEALAALAAAGWPTYWQEYQRARNLEQLGRADEARQGLRRAFEALLHEARRVTAPGLRGRWLSDKRKVADHLLEDAFARGDDATFHEALQRLKATGLSDPLREPTGDDSPALGAYRSARTRLRTLDAELTGYAEPGGAVGRRDPVREAERRALLARLERLEATLDTREQGLIGARAATLAELQAALPPGAVLLDLALLRDGLRAALITREGRRLVALGDPGWSRGQAEAALGEALARLDDLTAEARRALQLADLPRANRLYTELGVLEELHRLLLGAPAVQEALAGARELIVVPHRQTFAVPWHLLRHEGRFLVERLPVSVLPAAPLLTARAPAPPALTRRSRVLFLVTAREPRNQRLALAEAEQAIRRFRNVVLLTGAEASPARLAAEAEAFEVIHFAGHAAHEPSFPTLSHLALGAGDDDEPAWERLTLRDVLRLRLRAALVILSGCETARASAGASDVPLGLSQAFLAAGARAVLGSHWPFEPDASRALLPPFYDALLAGASPQEALRAAQLAAMQRDDSASAPCAWGTFSVTFAPAPPTEGGGSTTAGARSGRTAPGRDRT